jgi:hypothetical protein
VRQRRVEASLGEAGGAALEGSNGDHRPNALLVLVPTRELATQVLAAARSFGSVHSLALGGGPGAAPRGGRRGPAGVRRGKVG